MRKIEKQFTSNWFVSLLLLAGCFSQVTLATWSIESLQPPREVILQEFARETELDRRPLEVGQRLIIRSAITNEITGFAEVTHLLEVYPSAQVVARVILHERNVLVAPGDKIEIPDFDNQVKDYPGRGDLLLSNNRNVSARYKRLAWFGLFLGDGHSLAKDETLVDVSTLVAHGITDRLTLGTIVVADIVAPNLIVKYTLFDNNYFTVTPSLTGWYAPKTRASALQMRTLFSTNVNAKLISHTAISAVWANGSLEESKVNSAILRTELQSGFEYIFDSWDRLLFGPSYSFSLGTVGGYLAYLAVWDHFHVTLGIQTQNFTDFRIDPTKAYNFNVTMFWRF